jgi:hypothetical protein
MNSAGHRMVGSETLASVGVYAPYHTTHVPGTAVVLPRSLGSSMHLELSMYVRLMPMLLPLLLLLLLVPLQCC